MDSESGDPSDNISDWDYMSSMQLENERARAALYPVRFILPFQTPLIILSLPKECS